MIRINGYLVEEYEGEVDSLRKVESGIQEDHVEDLETQDFSSNKLIIEAE